VCILPTAIFAQEQPAPTDGVSLTIYNQGQALVQDRRTFTFETGETTLNFTDVASQIDATSVSFVSLTDPTGTYVIEQTYAYDLVGAEALYSRFIDQNLQITLEDGTVTSGRLLSAQYGTVVLQQDDGSLVMADGTKIRDVRFPSLPDGLITRPTLRWIVDSITGGEQQVALTYLTNGISWTADYTVLLGRDNSALDLNGWVTFVNGSGTAYRDAQIKLIAGDVNRLPTVDAFAVAENQAMMLRMDGAPAPAVEQREFFEYQLYEIGRPVTLGNNETKQVEFVSGTNVPATTFFVYDGSPNYFGYNYAVTDNSYVLTGVTDVQSYLEFTTDEENGLGADLPAGRIRVYQEDIDGSALLIGENTIDHTPEGEDVQIYLGNAFDLVGEHIQTKFEPLGSQVIEESFEIRLRNRKDDETVEIRVPERMFRWSAWEILQSSDPYTQLDSSTVEFRVNVEPGAEKIITYTVRYTFP
jgi:hypothetical protein